MYFLFSCIDCAICCQVEPASETELTGATNLMAHYCLEHSYNKFTGKKVPPAVSPTAKLIVTKNSIKKVH